MKRIALLLALSCGFAHTAEAYRGDRVTWTPKELTIDGRSIDGNARERFLYLQDRLAQCAATETKAKARATRQNVGQAVGLGGLAGLLLVQVVNPLALGAVIGFAVISITGNIVAIEAIGSMKKLIRLYEAECGR